MSVKQEKDSINVVELASSDDEEERIGVETRTNDTLLRSVQVSGSVTIPVSSSIHQNQNFGSRSFWKAGDFDAGPTKSAYGQGELEHARVHPKFLHSNATSHKWAFGAIAELLDNAVDEICTGATFVKVDKIYDSKDNAPALLFQDDGGGMDPECMRQCMSLGYSKKKSNTTIGQYGNGFKTSTMRLGSDVIVFSRTTRGRRTTKSIGLLSYTFLRRTGQDDVIVPMVDFELSDSEKLKPIIYSSQDDWSNNLKLILEWSPFFSEEELMLQFDDIGPHGTKIIVYNLWLNDDGVLELDFDYDEEDIRLRDEVNNGKLSKKHDRLIESHISYRMRYSLRAYASMLYLRKLPNFHIILRGEPVQQFNISDESKFSEVVMYRPNLGIASKEVSVETTIGFVKEAPALGVSGFNVYHKNRLIRPFWKVTSDGSSRGNGVIGFLEANFIEPAHDKQDFERSALFLRLEMRLKQMIVDYWKTHCHLLGLKSPIPDIRNMQNECPKDQTIGGFAANLQNELVSDQHVIGLSANLQKEMRLNQPVVGLASNLQPGLSNTQPVVGLAANFQKDLPAVQPIIGLAADGRLQAHAMNTGNPMEGSGYVGSCEQGASVDSSSSALVDQICEENIQLFMKCEEHRQKEIELKQTVEELERELEETKRKCSQLSSHLESQRKHKTMKQPTEKT